MAHPGSPTIPERRSQGYPMRIVEFGDFQCPFCQNFHFAVEELMDELTDQVSLVYYDYPLDGHPFAVAAALAARCARADGRFEEMATELFAKQDSIGLRSWLSYARSAGISDTAGFRSCMQDSVSQAGVDADHALGTELGVMGTPTVIINGWRFNMPPSVDSLKHYAREIVDGRSPFVARR
ncbi:MAG: hypothetical protein AMS18_13800 [Gemmatimonas sp. SG8_17]|nr:MAG: hypothetical protein AMS18_13800 [Gemmatimonas sp. SG8_17]